MSVQLVIFDCDGVLFHSEQANVAFYKEVLRRAGAPPLADEGEAACHALASAQLFEHYFGDRPELLAHVREIARATDYTPFFSLMEPRPRVHETLTRLKRRYKTAMATNRGKTTHEVLDFFALASVFDLAVGANDVERPKPHPDMLLMCAERLGVAPSAAVYVGDQLTDAESARAAGIRFVGMGPAAASAAYAIDALEELEGLLARL